MDLAVESSDVIAYGVARQMQCRGNFLVALALAHQTQYLSFARGQIGQFTLAAARVVRLTDLRELFDHGTTKPRGVLHDGLDRGNQLDLGSLALSDILQDTQNAWLSVNRNGLGRSQAVDQGAFLGSQLDFVIAQAAMRLKCRFQLAVRLRVGPH